MSPVFPADIVDVDKLQVSLMYERGRLQGLIGPLVRHVAARDPAKLGIDEHRKPIESRFIAATTCAQQTCNFGRGSRRNGNLRLDYTDSTGRKTFSAVVVFTLDFR